MAIDPSKMNWIADFADRLETIRTGADAYWAALVRVFEINVQTYQQRCHWTGLSVSIRSLGPLDVEIRVASDAVTSARGIQVSHQVRLEKDQIEAHIVYAAPGSPIGSHSKKWRIDVGEGGELVAVDGNKNVLDERELCRQVLEPILFPGPTVKVTKYGRRED